MTELPPPPPQVALAKEESRFPCENCGADYRFDPASGKNICPHCGHEDTLVTSSPWTTNIAEIDFQRTLDSGQDTTESEDIRVSSCPNCAAEIRFEDETHAQDCPFCATPVVVDTGESRRIKPQAVLPFSIAENAARKAMQDWLGRLWFAPNALREYARHGRKMDGIYVPYWTFDADTKTRYSGMRGDIYYETRNVMRDGKSQTERVQKIRWTPRSGRVKRFFDDVLVLASRSLPLKYTEALEPWPMEDLKPYSPAYLAGFRSESYTVGLSEGYTHAQGKMKKVIEKDVRFDIGGDRQQITTMNTDIQDVTFKHVLLPVWLAAYKFRGKSYRFVVNGQTGHVQGERPWSPWKIAFAVALGLILAGTLGYYGSQMQ